MKWQGNQESWKNIEDLIPKFVDIPVLLRNHLIIGTKEILILMPNCSFLPHFEDEWIWKLNSICTFFVKLAYRSLAEEFAEEFNWKEIWIKGLTPKINYFCWATTHGRILTIDSLNKRGFSFVNRCVLCYHDMESIDHIFLHNNYAKDIWDAILRDFIKLWPLSPHCHHVVKNLWLQTPPIMPWNLWKEKNNII